MSKEIWLGIGSICGVLGLQIGLAIVLYHFLGEFGFVLWFPLFLGGFYLLNKYSGGK